MTVAKVAKGLNHFHNVYRAEHLVLAGREVVDEAGSRVVALLGSGN